MDQQEQTRQYFRKVAGEWQSKSADNSGRHSVIQGRSRAVIEVVEAAKDARRFLDVGCGTGQLVIDVAKLGLTAEGNDFADEMIQTCNDNAKAANVEAKFVGGSFFDAPFEENAYDVISGQGLIEYLSADEMMQFYRRSFDLLRPGGSLVVGSRNRLFNAFSLNDFTTLELGLGTLDALVLEAVAFENSGSQEQAFEALRDHERIDPQPKSHPITGIAVDTRYQYTPGDLVYRLRSAGFLPKTIFPVHYHGVTPTLKKEQPELHSDFALAMAEIGVRDQRLVPYSSTFVLEVEKPA